MSELSGTNGGRKGGGIRETFIEHLSQACAKESFLMFTLPAARWKISPLLLLIWKLSVGRNLLEMKQLQVPELPFASRRIRATCFARGLNPAP